jgi:hypothetical protein
MKTVVTTERRKNIAVLADFTENPRKEIAPLLNLRRFEPIVSTHRILNFKAMSFHFIRCVGIIEKSRFTLFLFGHRALNGLT